jgi:hypothetical protein
MENEENRAEHDKPISNSQKIIGDVFSQQKYGFVVANLAPITVTIQTDQTVDFSNVHNFVKNFVWEPIQSTYCRGKRKLHWVF